MPLSILHAVEFYAPRVGGAETVVQKISEGLVARGHRVTVATTKIPEREYLALNGVQIVEFDVRGNLIQGFTGTDVARYPGFVEASRADVFMNYAAQQWSADLAFENVVRGKAGAVNIIAPCGYSWFSEDDRKLDASGYGFYYRNIIPQVVPAYDAAVYHSPTYQDYRFGEAHGFTNGVVIPNFVDEAEFLSPPDPNFRAKYGITSRFMLLSVGNFLPSKRHSALIEIFRSLGRDDTTLVLVGRDGGCLEALKQQARGLSVIFLTDVPRSDTVAAFKSADVFLFASQVEASPLVIIEAKAAALPFISTDCGNIRDFAGGIVCEESDISKQVLVLLNDEGARKNLGRLGRDEWLSRLTAKAVITQYENLYVELLERKKLRPNY